nr:MAG TPA: hypothetical protein [Caudoviricetes sp.]
MILTTNELRNIIERASDKLSDSLLAQGVFALMDTMVDEMESVGWKGDTTDEAFELLANTFKQLSAEYRETVTVFTDELRKEKGIYDTSIN